MYSTLIHPLCLQAASLGIGRTLESSKGLLEQGPMQAAIEWMGVRAAQNHSYVLETLSSEEERHMLFIHMAEKGVTY